MEITVPGSRTQTTEEKKDIVVSLDFDGCWACEFSDANKDNPDLPLKQLAQEATTILVGSNRQSHAFDFSNGENGSGSCFPHFRQYKDKFYPLLAADIQRQQPADFTLKKTADEDKFEYIADDYKRTLIYSQIQAMVELRKSEPFVFQFVDDREDILEALNNFFCDNPKFIPKDVTLQLFRYSPEKEITEPKQFCEPIHGTGKADANYVNTSNAISKYVDTVPTPSEDIWITSQEELKPYKNILRRDIIRNFGGAKQAQTKGTQTEINGISDITFSDEEEKQIKEMQEYAKVYAQASIGLSAHLNDKKKIKLECWHFCTCTSICWQ